jgi:hypothetical protein
MDIDNQNGAVWCHYGGFVPNITPKNIPRDLHRSLKSGQRRIIEV